MVRALIALLAIVGGGGCGRVAFDGVPDAAAPPDGAAPDVAPLCGAPTGHDEDADGVDDACDVCPQRGASQADTDADGVGDDCDLDGATAQARVLFDPFTTMTATWSFAAQHALVGDALRFPFVEGGAVPLRLAGPPGRTVLELGGEITQASAANPRQLLVSFGPAGPAGYYCELYDGPFGNQLNLTYTFDGVAFTPLDQAALPGRLEASAFRLIVVHTPPTMRCLLDWQGTTYDIGGTIPPGLDPQDLISIVALDVGVDLDHAVRLTTP